MMLITDPTKNGITFRIPKWFRFPILVLVVAMALGGMYTYSYIVDLESQLVQERSKTSSSDYDMMVLDQTIETMEQTEITRYNQLQSLAMLTVDLKDRLAELEAYKLVIDEKLGSAVITTTTQPEAVTRRSSGNPSLADNEPVLNDLTITEASAMDPVDEATMLHEETKAMGDDFTLEVDRLIEELTETMDKIETEKVSYEVRDEQVDEMLPYWDAYPSAIPVAGTSITSPYGYRRNPLGYGYEFHKGVDFKAKYTDVWASGAGKVTFASYHSGYGYMVVIDHGYGLVTKYAHLSKIKVSVGDQVDRYDVIAVSGNSGRSSGPHLHYEVLENGESLNPMDYVYKGE